MTATGRPAPLPKVIHIGPMAYSVTVDANDLLKATVEQRSSLFGWSCERRQVIGVDPDQAPGSKRDTVLHEVLHQVLCVSGLASEWGGDQEEQVVRRLTPWLVGVIRANPKLIEFLVDE